MEAESELYLTGIFANLEIVVKPFSLEILIASVIMLLLLLSSALVSGSEVAFFSLNPSERSHLSKSKSKINKLILKLLDNPERLLATILVANNFINVSIIILSSYITSSLFDFSDNPGLGFIVQVIVITFMLLLIGEILPKVYANRFALAFSRLMARPMDISERLFRPINWLLIHSTSVVQKKFEQRKKNISMDELSNALELTGHTIKDEKSILEGIVKFGNIDVSEIMTSRVDVLAVEINTRFNNLIELIVESGYSRIPVYENNFDNIKGILYIKDLLTHLGETDTFRWQSLLQPPYYVPETKKIDDLLKEFQLNKIHMAIVVDEYGGSSGIITLEDILEEIVGEITDETDEDEAIFTQIDKNNYLFEGKVLLNDLYKILNIDGKIFEEVKGDADTLAGLILEIRGEIPAKNEKIKLKNFEFKIVAVDNRRIRKIQVTLRP